MDLVFAFVILAAEVWALEHVNAVKYSSAGFFGHEALVEEQEPSWFGIVNILQNIWIWSELIVLLFNERRRAIHDFIAGTVVLHNEFATPAPKLAAHESNS